MYMIFLWGINEVENKRKLWNGKQVYGTDYVMKSYMKLEKKYLMDMAGLGGKKFILYHAADLRECYSGLAIVPPFQYMSLW